MRLEDVVARLNRFKRVDEKPFEAAKVVSEFNQRAYELFGRPLVKALANEYGAKLSREFHPLRFQRWAFSDLNPFLSWLAPAAQAVKAQRQALASDHPARQIESTASEVTERFARLFSGADAMRRPKPPSSRSTATSTRSTWATDAIPKQAAPTVDPRELPFVKEALASIDKGGYAEALARVAFLMAHQDEPLPLARVHLAQRTARRLSRPAA